MVTGNGFDFIFYCIIYPIMAEGSGADGMNEVRVEIIQA
jgi:hypothetical protein